MHCYRMMRQESNFFPRSTPNLPEIIPEFMSQVLKLVGSPLSRSSNVPNERLEQWFSDKDRNLYLGRSEEKNPY